MRVVERLKSLRRGVYDTLEEISGEGTVYIVGGFLRDVLIGRDTFDVDIACDSALELSRRFSRATRGKRVILSEKFAIVRVVLKGEPEIIVDFSDIQDGDIIDDLKGRDFTIDAMAYSMAEGELKDPFDGRGDIRRSLVRMVSEGGLRKDPLRCLRAYRLAVVLDFDIDQETRRAIARSSNPIIYIPFERVRGELHHILERRCAGILGQLVEDGLFHSLFPEIGGPPMSGISTPFHPLIAETLEEVAADDILPSYQREVQEILEEEKRLPLLKLSALFQDVVAGGETPVPEAMERITERAKFSLFEKRFLLSMAKGIDMMDGLMEKDYSVRGTNLQKDAHRFFKRFGDEGIPLLFLHGVRARAIRGGDIYRQRRDEIVRFFFENFRRPLARFIRGNDLIKAGVSRGPKIGEIIRRVHDAEKEGEIGSREECLRFVQREFGIDPGRFAPPSGRED